MRQALYETPNTGYIGDSFPHKRRTDDVEDKGIIDDIVEEGEEILGDVLEETAEAVGLIPDNDKRGMHTGTQ